MATTTNYSWTTPDDTDLVKDGAAAIRTLGSSVDTTTKALNPSTTLGDIEYRSSTANTNTRLGIGTTGQVLTVSGGVPSWAAPASSTPSFVGVSCTGTGTQSISNGTFTAIAWNTEEFDTDGFHSTSTNTSRITIPSGKAGKYLFTSHTFFDSISGTGRRFVRFYKNGSSTGIDFTETPPSSSAYVGISNTVILNLAVNDYVEAFAYQSSGVTITLDLSTMSFQAQFLGA
jgi:hypothetical protein